MVPKRGLEPPRPDGHYTLNVARLPIPPLRQVWPSPRPEERQGKRNRFCLGLKDFIFPLGRCSVKKVHGAKRSATFQDRVRQSVAETCAGAGAIQRPGEVWSGFS